MSSWEDPILRKPNLPTKQVIKACSIKIIMDWTISWKRREHRLLRNFRTKEFIRWIRIVELVILIVQETWLRSIVISKKGIRQGTLTISLIIKP